jgi:hypothetical protein
VRDLGSFDGEETQEPFGAFTLGGREWHLRDPEQVPFGYVRRARRAATSGEEAYEQVEPFFRATLLPAEGDDFAAFLDTSDVNLAQLARLMERIQAAITDRPTEPVSGSSATPRRTGRKSTGGSSSRAKPRLQSAS